MNRKNYAEKITFTYKKQNNKNKNVIYNLSNKRTLGQTIATQKLLIETKQLNSNFLLNKTIFNLVLFNAVNLIVSRKLLSAFYQLFNKKIILILTTTSFVTKQKKLSFDKKKKTKFLF